MNGNYRLRVTIKIEFSHGHHIELYQSKLNGAKLNNFIFIRQQIAENYFEYFRTA